MKDAAGSRRALPGSVSKELNRNNSRMHNIFLIIILVSLVALATYLVSDILSFRSGAAHEGAIFGLSFQDNGKIAMLEGWQEKGVKLIELGKYKEAIECFDKAISENSSDYRALINKGQALYALCSYEEALKCYDKALLLKPSDGKALYNKGLALLAMKRYDEAKEAFVGGERLGKWPNPLRSANSSNSSTAASDKSRQASSPVTTVTTGSRESRDTYRIAIDWTSVNRNEHSSLDEDRQHSTAIKSIKADKTESNTTYAKVYRNSSDVSNGSINISNSSAYILRNSSNVSYDLPAPGPTINSTENSSSATSKNISILDNSSVGHAVPKKTEINITASNATEINDNLTENVSVGSLAEAVNSVSDPMVLNLTNDTLDHTLDQKTSDNSSQKHYETPVEQSAYPVNPTENSTFDFTNVGADNINGQKISETVSESALAGSQASPHSYSQIATKKKISTNAPKKPAAPKSPTAKSRSKTMRTRNRGA